MKTIKIIGIIAILLILIFSVKGYYSQTESNNIQENKEPVQIVNGIQEVKLSWGKLNYEPQEIIVKKDIPVRITADLSRLTGCYRSFNILGLNIYKYFKERDNTLEFTPTQSGKFRYSCSMGMGTGKFIVL